MTIHITEDYHCTACGRFYIPLSNNHCYACGVKNDPPPIDYISQFVASLKWNLDHYGSFISPAWIDMTNADKVLYLICLIFAQRKDNCDVSNFFEKIVSKLRFQEDQEYLKTNILDLCIEISKEIYPS